MAVTGIKQVAATLARVNAEIERSAARGLSRGVLLGQTVVQRAASGRPGPNVITGNFRRSIVGESEGLVGQIGSNAPQGARLEFGFYGTDILGRSYSQPPYPSFLPSVPEITRAVVEEITAEIEGIG